MSVRLDCSILIEQMLTNVKSDIDLLELFDALRSNGSVVSLEIRGTKLGCV